MDKSDISSTDKAAHFLHETGDAKEFKIIGEYDETIIWKKGAISDINIVLNYDKSENYHEDY